MAGPGAPTANPATRVVRETYWLRTAADALLTSSDATRFLSHSKRYEPVPKPPSCAVPVACLVTSADFGVRGHALSLPRP